jgi:ribokinase
LKKVTYLTPNETEAALLTGIKISTHEDAETAAKILLAKGVKHVIMTLAEKGSLIADASGIRHIKGYTVNAIDTVAAGDSFNGALAYALTNGKTLDEAVKLANAVGALTVTKAGAIPSLPYIDEVEAFIHHKTLSINSTSQSSHE